MTEYIDGHRWPQRATSPTCSCGKPFPEDGGKEGVCECCSTCAPSSEVSAASTPSLTSTSEDGSPDLTDLPPFSVTADYRTCMVAVLFDPSHIPFLMRHPLFQGSADLLRGAQIDCELWIDEQIKDTRDRQITAGL